MRIEWLYEARCEFEEQLAYYRSRGGAEAAHARQFSGAGPAIAVGADAAGAVHAFPRLLTQRFHIHADFLQGCSGETPRIRG